MAMFVVKSIHIQINSQVMDLSIQDHTTRCTWVYDPNSVLQRLGTTVLSNNMAQQGTRSVIGCAVRILISPQISTVNNMNI